MWGYFSNKLALKGCQQHRYSKLLSGKPPGRFASVLKKFSSRNSFLAKFPRIFGTVYFSKYK